MAKKKEGSAEEAPQSTVVAQEIVFEYKKVMEEDGLSKNDLPKGIKSQIQVLDAQTAKYKKNPTENLLNSVRTQDVKIADQIHSFIEESIVEQTEEDKLKQQQMENEEKEKLAAAEKEKTEKETAEKETAEATAKAKDAEEAAIKAKNEADELAAKEKAAADKKEKEGAFENPYLKGILGQ